MKLARISLFSMLCAGLPCHQVQAQVPAASDRAAQLYSANNLAVPGALPFHLKLEFQIFELSGKPGAAGTLEEWWTSSNSKRVVIKAPWLKEDGKPIHENAPDAVRGSYLVDLLLGAVLDPVQSRTLPGAVSKEESLGKAVLTCVGPATQKNGSVGVLPTLCTEPDKEAVRYMSMMNGLEEVTRNSIGLFRNTHVAEDVQISFGGHPAISGKVTTLQGIEPTVAQSANGNGDASKDDVPATSSEASKEPSRPHVSGGILLGSRIKYVEPEYPAIAKAAHMSGTVILRAIISKDGSIQDLVPLVTTDAVFTSSAMEAVRQWRYKPYFLNGQATDVDTTITVNFAVGTPPQLR